MLVRASSIPFMGQNETGTPPLPGKPAPFPSLLNVSRWRKKGFSTLERQELFTAGNAAEVPRRKPDGTELKNPFPVKGVLFLVVAFVSHKGFISTAAGVCSKTKL